MKFILFLLSSAGSRHLILIHFLLGAYTVQISIIVNASSLKRQISDQNISINTQIKLCFHFLTFSPAKSVPLFPVFLQSHDFSFFPFSQLLILRHIYSNNWYKIFRLRLADKRALKYFWWKIGGYPWGQLSIFRRWLEKSIFSSGLW